MSFSDPKFIGKSFVVDSRTVPPPTPEQEARDKKMKQNLETVQSHMHVREDTMTVDLWYPDLEGNQRYLEVGMFDVRATDGIRLSYDKARDGWVVEQRVTLEECADDSDDNTNWKEVAFVESWQRQEAYDAKIKEGLDSKAALEAADRGLKPLFFIPEMVASLLPLSQQDRKRVLEGIAIVAPKQLDDLIDTLNLALLRSKHTGEYTPKLKEL